MHLNKIFISLVILIGLSFCWFSINSILDLTQVLSLNCQTEAEILTSRIHREGENKFLLVSTINYEVNGIQYIAEKKMTQYPNRFAAERGGLRLERQGRIPIWFDSKNPSHSNFFKKFPYKNAATSILLAFLGLYFGFYSSFIRKSNEST